MKEVEVRFRDHYGDRYYREWKAAYDSPENKQMLVELNARRAELVALRLRLVELEACT